MVCYQGFCVWWPYSNRGVYINSIGYRTIGSIPCGQCLDRTFGNFPPIYGPHLYTDWQLWLVGKMVEPGEVGQTNRQTDVLTKYIISLLCNAIRMMKMLIQGSSDIISPLFTIPICKICTKIQSSDVSRGPLGLYCPLNMGILVKLNVPNQWQASFMWYLHQKNLNRSDLGSASWSLI